LHGEFDFLLQRFKRDDEECSFFELTDQCQTGYLSSGLQELSAYFSNRMSYEEVEKLIQRMTGQQALSDQGIWQGVIAKAVSVSQQSADEAQKVLKASGNLSFIVNQKSSCLRMAFKSNGKRRLGTPQNKKNWLKT
jgi:hypothetical protein